MTERMPHSSAQSSPKPDPAAYVYQSATMIGLSIPLEYDQGVTENFARISAVAQLVMEFPIAEAIEMAPVFEP